MSCFPFLFRKTREQEDRTPGESAAVRWWEVWQKLSRRMNIVQKLCNHAYNFKNGICGITIPCIQRIHEGRRG
jgi:hypothetical protein